MEHWKSGLVYRIAFNGCVSAMDIRQVNERSDAKLVELCNSGTRDEAISAFESLYRRHRDYVVRVSLRFGSDREIAADVLQETFLYLLKKFPPGGDGLALTGQLRSLLYPVSKNLTLNALRRQRRIRPSALEPDQLPGPGSVDSHYDDLARLVSGLSGRHREVVLLRFVDGMTLREIAEVLGIPAGTVKSRLSIATRTLRSIAENEDANKK